MEQSFGDIVLSIFNIAIIGGIALTIFMIVFQGINVLNSRGDPSAFSRAKEKIKNILIGLAVLLLSYVLLYTINPNILNLELNIGEINITPSIFTPPAPPVKELDVYTFEEIPLGTITEELLAAISSVETPCYQYETNFKDASGNIIVGNVIDQNGDGKIDEKDILLNKDLFYCMNLLTSAYAAKVEYHLKPLINDLNNLMESGCACSNLYVGRLEGQGFVSRSCGGDPPLVYEDVMLLPDNSGYYYPIDCPTDNCSPCRTPYSFCSQVCGGQYGCPEAQPSYSGPITNPYTESYGVKQYKYDTCRNRLELTCKTEEIQQLITGEKPRQACYDANLIKESGIDESIFFTLNDGVERIEYFKDYFQKRVVQLSCAKDKMKIPWGERITLAEYEKLKSEITSYKVEKATFEDYDITRYCGEFNSQGEALTDYEPCKIVEDERQYFYDGDAATFYFSEDYNSYKNYITRNKTQQKCTVIEGDMELGDYAGVIPIGEVVDEAQEWGKIIADAMDRISLESRAIIDNTITISNIPSTCSASRCTTYNAHYGYTTCSGRCGGKKCSCSQVRTWGCGEAVPNSMVPNKYYTAQVPCYGVGWCSTCDWYPKRYPFYSCGGVPTSLNRRCLCGMTTYRVPRPQHYVCDYEDFCDSVKKIYWNNDNIGKDNFVATNNTSEKSKRELNLSKIGHLQRFKGYAQALIDLSKIKVVSPNYNISSLDIIGDICECDLVGPPSTSIFVSQSSYNYSCSYNYQPVPVQAEHSNCPYSYAGPVGMYWCQKENRYWSCPTISSQCDSLPPYVPTEPVDDPTEPVDDDNDPINDPIDDDDDEVLECPYEHMGPEDEFYWCEKQGAYWSCPVREEDKEDCLINAEEELSCSTDPDYEIGEEIYWCERQQTYWSCPVDRKVCDELFCPSGIEATGVYYCPADDNYWCVEPSEHCFSGSDHEVIDCPYIFTQEIEDIYGSGNSWCEKQGVYWSCPIREEDRHLCYENDIVSSYTFNENNIALRKENPLLIIFNNIKDLVVGFFVEKTNSIALESKKYLSEYLGIENAFAKKKKNTISCYVGSLPACCVSVSTNQSFTSTDSSKNIEIKNRFEILEKLSYSRKKFTGCVKGYSSGYKDNPTEVVEVMSCMEGITEPGVLILPEFPYPGKGNVNPPYNNCYPQNSDRLTEDQKSQCFYNPLREGTASNPGCLLITKEYMDNYYCCN